MTAIILPFPARNRVPDTHDVRDGRAEYRWVASPLDPHGEMLLAQMDSAGQAQIREWL